VRGVIARLSPQRTELVYLLAGVVAVLAGALVAKAPPAGIALVALVCAAALAVRLTRLGMVELTLAALPWLVIFDGLMPSLLKTFVATAAAASLLWLAIPLRFRHVFDPVVAVLFIAVLCANVLFATDSQQFIQFAKFLIFPIVCLAVLSDRAQEEMPRARNVILASCLAAMVVQLGIVAAGLGQTGTKYEIGEKLGYGRGILHEMALTFVVIAAAGLVSSKRVLLQAGFFALGAVPALLTGVRSALLALIVVLLIFVLRSRLDRRALATVLVILAAAMASGGIQIVQNRFNAEQQQETSFSSLGSGRTEIWSAALTPWWNDGPPQWLFGTGLRSVEEQELHDLGKVFIGHSDLIEVGVQLGLVGLALWACLWYALLRSPLENIVLVPLIVYSLVNGSIEYVAPTALGLAFAAACRPPPEPPPRPQTAS
jgi:O-antigen ligase